MKTLIFCLTLILCCCVQLVYCQDGKLDTTFHTFGLDTVDFNEQDDFAYPSLTQPDNKIVVAGHTYSGTNYDFAIIRYKQDGSVDHTFSEDGRLIVDWNGGDDFVNSLALQPDGKILVSGSAASGSNHDFALLRLNQDGTPDSIFSDDGMLTTNVGSSAGPLTTIVQPDGKIIVAGYSVNADFDFTVIRYLPNGDPDNSFGINGIAVTPISTIDDVGVSAVLQPDGKIVMTGYGFNTTDVDVALARYNTDGTLDTSFNTTGFTLTHVSDQPDYGRAIALLSSGKIIVGGYSNKELNSDFMLVQYNNDGSPDSSFNGGAAVLTDFNDGDDQAISMAVLPDNKIVLAGYATTLSGIDFALARYHPDAVLDTSFSVNGKITTDFGGDDYGAILTQGDERLALAGYTIQLGDIDFAVSAYLCDTCSVTIDIATVIQQPVDSNIQAYLFPNPVGDVAYLKYASDAANVSLKLYDKDGRLVQIFMDNEWKSKGLYTDELNFKSIHPGSYFLEYTMRNESRTIEIVKQ